MAYKWLATNLNQRPDPPIPRQATPGSAASESLGARQGHALPLRGLRASGWLCGAGGLGPKVARCGFGVYIYNIQYILYHYIPIYI